MSEHRAPLPSTVRSFREWGCDDAAASLAASVQRPPIGALAMDGHGARYLVKVEGVVDRFKKRTRRLRRNPDRLRLLEIAASDAMRQFRCLALEAQDPGLLTWSTLVLEGHARARWSRLLPGDHIEELRIDDGISGPVSRSGIVFSVSAEDSVLALIVQWDNGSKETVMPTSGRSLLLSVNDASELSQRMSGREARHRRRAVQRLRKALVLDVLRPRERLIADVAAETTIHSLLDRTVERAMPVILYATTERVLWAGFDGSDQYEARELGNDGSVRAIGFAGFLDIFGGSVNEGPRGSYPGPGFGFIALSAEQAALLSSGVVEGLVSTREMKIWAMEVSGTDGAGFGLDGIGGVMPRAEFFQLFRFPVWGPVAARLIVEASTRNSLRLA